MRSSDRIVLRVSSVRILCSGQGVAIADKFAASICVNHPPPPRGGLVVFFGLLAVGATFVSIVSDNVVSIVCSLLRS